MTAGADSFSDRALLARYHDILGKLVAVAENEQKLLEADRGPLPADLVRRKEALVQDYALLTAGVRARARQLQAAGLLDPAGLERRIRHLVALMKENQILLNARKVRTAERVETVMQALLREEERQQASAHPLDLSFEEEPPHPPLRA